MDEEVAAELAGLVPQGAAHALAAVLPGLGLVGGAPTSVAPAGGKKRDGEVEAGPGQGLGQTSGENGEAGPGTAGPGPASAEAVAGGGGAEASRRGGEAEGEEAAAVVSPLYKVRGAVWGEHPKGGSGAHIGVEGGKTPRVVQGHTAGLRGKTPQGGSRGTQ